MKKYITFLLLLLGSICLNAQNPANLIQGPGPMYKVNTEGVNTKPKKRLFKKKPKPKPDVQEFSFTVVPKAIVNEPDTPILNINLLDTTIRVFKGNQFRVVYKLACEKCFRVDSLERDTNSIERFGIGKKARIYTQIDALFIPIENVQAYNRANQETDPDIIQLRKEIADRQKRIDIIKANNAKTKAQ